MWRRLSWCLVAINTRYPRVGPSIPEIELLSQGWVNYKISIKSGIKVAILVDKFKRCATAFAPDLRNAYYSEVKQCLESLFCLDWSDFRCQTLHRIEPRLKAKTGIPYYAYSLEQGLVVSNLLMHLIHEFIVDMAGIGTFTFVNVACLDSRMSIT